MGLSNDIYDAYLKSASGGGDGKDLPDDVKKTLKTLGEDISKAITTFLVKQPLTMNKIKSINEVEELSTSSPLQADVLDTLKVEAGVEVQVDPNTGIGKTILPGNLINTKKAVLIPALNLKKKGGQGGVMTSKGHSYIGRNPVDPSETNEETTEVKLLEENIVED